MKRTRSGLCPSFRSTRTLLSTLAAGVLTACLPSLSSKTPAPEPVDSSATAESIPDEGADRIAQLESEVRQLRDRALKAELGLMERDAQIRQLEQQLIQQQSMLDETIEEIVRTKAKLRGMESKAQAASQLAEAEIALKALADLTGGTGAPEYTQAAELIEDGTKEFGEENFGGAIYLAGQAKSLISLAEARLGEREQIDAGEGEVALSVPLPLEVTANTNVRAGPGLDRPVLTTLRRATRVVGYSYKGGWVRVRLEDGREGWIYQALLKGR